MNAFHDKEKGFGIQYDDIYLINGARTPFGKFCGTLGQISPTDLGIYASRAALENANVDGEVIDQVIALLRSCECPNMMQRQPKLPMWGVDIESRVWQIFI